MHDVRKTVKGISLSKVTGSSFSLRLVFVVTAMDAVVDAPL